MQISFINSKASFLVKNVPRSQFFWTENNKISDYMYMYLWDVFITTDKHV